MTTKPLRISKIDWSNPLTKGMVFCAFLNEMAGVPTDAITGAQFTMNASTWVPSGVSTAFVAVGAFCPTAITQFGTDDFSVALMISGQTTTGNYYYLSNGSSSSLTGLWGFMSGIAAANISFATYGGGGFTQTPLILPSNSSHLFVGVRRGATAELYMDGAFKSATTGTIRNVNCATPGVKLGVYTAAGSNTKAANRESVQVWNRALSVDEIRTLGGDPWQLLAQSSPSSILAFLSQPPATIAIWCKVAGSLKQAQALWIKTGGNLHEATSISGKVSGSIKSIL